MKLALKALALLLAVIGTGAATVALLNEDIPDFAVPDGDWQASNLLDGRVYYTEDTIVETGEVVRDEMVFRDGKFQSVMCQVYCDFGWTDYKTKQVGDVLHWTATTRCPTAPHTVVFYGIVDGDKVDIQGSWTTRRWYWTHQVNLVGFGSTERPDDHALES